MIVVAHVQQFLTKIVNNIVTFINLEWFKFPYFALESGSLTSHRFDEHTNCHSTWKSIRVDYDVRTHATLTKWHIDLRP